jgi:hypothetical protein
MIHPALYISAQRIPFIPTRIVRAFNDNVAVPSFTADGADVAHNAPCAVLATSAAVVSLHDPEVAQ